MCLRADASCFSVWCPAARFRAFGPWTRGAILGLVGAGRAALASAVVSIDVCGSHSPFWLRGLPCLFGREQWKRWLTSTLKQPVEMP